MAERWGSDQEVGAELLGGLDDLDALLFAERGKLDEALEVVRDARGPSARVLAAGLGEREAEAPAAMEAAAQVEMGRLRSYLPVLDTIITLSPLLGLLGTVTGMIAAFGILSTSGMNQPTAITGGVAEALIATAAGLAIAIATLVPYNFFTARAEQAIDAMERLASRLDRALRSSHRETIVARRRARLARTEAAAECVTPAPPG